MKICCVTGNRPQKFPWKYGKGFKYKKYLAGLARRIKELIEGGYTYFISGGALGVDLDFAEAVLRAKRRLRGRSCLRSRRRWGVVLKVRPTPLIPLPRRGHDGALLS